jgi:predicted SAM-dependent methyltransferase
LPLRDNSIDVITSLDVVEHIQNHVGLLREFHRIVKPGGLVIITVPAYKWLWTYWDTILGHKRRYTRTSFRNLAGKTDFKVIKLSHFYSYLLPMAMTFRLIKSVTDNKQKPKSDFIRLPIWANKLLLGLSAIETQFVNVMNLPAGLSLVCVLQKPEN